MKILALFTLLCAVIAQAQDHDTQLLTPSEYKEFLDKVDADLPKWETALKKIDPAKMNVSYAVGKQIEQWKDHALENVTWSRENVAKERVKHTVSGELRLKTFLQGAFDAMDEVLRIEETAGVMRSDLEKYEPEQGTLISRIHNDLIARVELLEKGTCP